MIIGNGSGNELIDQAFFGFSPVEDLTIVASSLPNDDSERKWMALLREHVRLKSHPDIQIPPHALSYFLFSSEHAAVLRRVRHGDSVGRNNSHVLIGPPGVLTARVALGLELWPGWQADPPVDRKMPRLHPSELDWGFDPADKLRARVRDKPGGLEQVLGWLLEKPGRPLSIIGCPAEDRVALLWGLLEIGAPFLDSQDLHRNWTFSTYETDHGAAIQYLLETVCLPASPVGISAADRTSVDLTRSDSASPRAANQARALVAQYIHGAPVLAKHGGPALTEHDRPASAERGGPAPVEGDWFALAERDRFAPVEPAQGPQQASTPAMSTSSAPDPAGPPDLAGMVRSLMGAQRREDFQDRLSTLESHAVNGLTRQEIRAQLDSDDYGITQIYRLFPSRADREAAFKRIIVVAFGWALVDFRDSAVRQYVARLIEQHSKDEFIRTLLQTAEMHNWHDQIVFSAIRPGPGQQKSTDLDQAKGSRSELTPSPGTDEGPAEPNRPVSPAGPVSRVRRVLPAPVELLDKYKKLSVTALWTLGLILSFVFGLFAGGFFTPDPAAVAPAPTPSESMPATPDLVAADRPDVAARIDKEPKDPNIVQLSVKPKQPLPDGAQLWLLVERGDGTRFPQPKHCSPEGENWECTQIYKFSDAATNDYRIVLFIVNQEAANFLDEYEKKRPKETPGDGIKIEEFPPGATETDLSLTVP